MNSQKVGKKELGELFKKGKKIYKGYFIVYYKDYSSNVVKIGIKKKVGNSVKRNYHKRVLRSIIRFLRKNKDFVGNKLVLIVILKEIDFSFEEAVKRLSDTFRTIYC